MDAQPKKRVRRKAQRPEEIVRAAIGVFCEKHYAGASFGAVAERLGISRSTIYLYYPDKPTLFKACVRSVVGEKKRLFLESGIGAGTGLEDKLKALSRALGEVFSDRVFIEFVIMVLSESREFPVLGRIWLEEVVMVLNGLWEEIMADEPFGEFTRKMLLLELSSCFMLSAFGERLFGGRSIHPGVAALAERLPAYVLQNIAACAGEKSS